MSSYPDRALWSFVEKCGKRGHVNKASAKIHRNSLRAKGQHVRAYYCKPENDGCGMWHVGHLPYAVLKGYVSDDEFYGKR